MAARQVSIPSPTIRTSPGGARRTAPREDCTCPVRLEEILATERAAADGNARTVGIHHEFLAAQLVVALWPANLDVPRTVDVKLLGQTGAESEDRASALPQFACDGIAHGTM